MTKTIALALALVVAPLTAKAEVWNLHQSGYWNVLYFGGDESEQCRAQVDIDDGIVFALTYDQFGFDGNLLDERINWGEGESSVDIWIDRHDYFTPTVAYNVGMLWFDITNERFIEQLWNGKAVYIDTDRDGTSDYWFSLNGSAEAMAAFASCTERMSEPRRQAGAPA